jgi:hypothetical protein
MFVLDGGKTAMRKVGYGALVLGLLWLSLPAAAEISGVLLTDPNNPTPIADGIVAYQNSETWTTTDPNGRFSLPNPTGTDLVVTGAAKGYFINGLLAPSPPASGVQIFLEPTPTGQAANYPWLLTPDEFGCGNCHPDQVALWTGSLMAKTGLNQWVYDMYNGTGTAGGTGGFVYTRDSMHSATNPKGECGACHQPERWIKDPNKPALDDFGSPSEEALHGISCEVCHKVGDVDESKFNLPGFFPGAATVTLPNFPFESQVEYGTLWDVTFRDSFPPIQPGSMRASYQPQLVAELCALCHEDKNDLDQDQQFDDIPARETYSEWADSDYGNPLSPSYKTCVDCHMKPYGGDVICNALFPPLIRDPNTLSTHRIEGTTAEFLEEAVELTMQVTPAGQQLEVEVSIENTLTGHHVPSGESMRNMILLVEAWLNGQDPLVNPLPDTGGQTVHELGGIGDPAQGDYAGLPGKLYAKLLEDPNGNSPVMFTEAAAITFDNRIAAFDTDTTQYSFTAPAEGGLVHVRARLIYRRTFPVFRDAKGWTQDGHGNALKDIASPDFGHLMETAQEDVTVAVGPLGKQDQKCVNSINKGAAKVAKAQAGDNVACIKNGGKGKLSGTVENCITSDPKGKVNKAANKIKTADCPGGAPPAAIPGLQTSSGAIKTIMVDKDVDLIHAVFGTDLDSVVVVSDKAVPGSKDAAKCQAAVAKAIGKCQDAKLSSFNSCKKGGFKAGTITDAGTLEAECMTPDIPDGKGKIGKKCAGFDLAKKCSGTDNDALFPGCAPGVDAACLDQKVECEVCKALNALDGLSRNCDEFDNDSADGSCL